MSSNERKSLFVIGGGGGGENSTVIPVVITDDDEENQSKTHLSPRAPPPSPAKRPSPNLSHSVSSPIMDMMNTVEVVDDLAVNRWLMRIMRLNSTESNNSNSSNSSSSSSIRMRRRSAQLGSSPPNNNNSNMLLRPPASCGRGRRFSDSLGLFSSTNAQGGMIGGKSTSRSGSRKGNNYN